MDRRKKRTSTNQYMMYIEMMEQDPIFATARVPRDCDVNYLHKKWKELSDKLNTCSSGPKLTSDEWRKRLNDWKNTTRCKYRRGLSGEKDVSLTSLELKALNLFGKAPTFNPHPTDQLSIQLKSEKSETEDEMEQQRTSESFQKELQAAVEEAIGGDDDDEDDQEDPLVDDNDEPAELLSSVTTSGVSSGSNAGGANTIATYNTIVVENAAPYDVEEEESAEEHLEFIAPRRVVTGPASVSVSTSTVATGVQTIVTASPTTAAVTKLINGDIPLKRLRTQAPEQIIYEVKKAPMVTRGNITIHNSAAPPQSPAQQTKQSSHPPQTVARSAAFNPSDSREIAHQLKRIADIKSEKLKFEIARFKFNNPGFQHAFNPPS